MKKITIASTALVLMFFLPSESAFAADYYVLTGQNTDTKNKSNAYVKIPIAIYKTSKHTKNKVKKAWHADNEDEWSCCYYDLSTKVYGPFSSWDEAVSERSRFVKKMLNKWPNSDKKGVMISTKFTINYTY